jgi:hypothetical protein
VLALLLIFFIASNLLICRRILSYVRGVTVFGLV